MKKNILIVIAVLLCTQLLQAQKGNFDLGFKLQPVFSWFGSMDGGAKTEGMHVGYSYGIMGDFYLKDNYAISTEFLVTSMGGKASFNNDDREGDAKYRLTYVEIPVSLKLKTNRSTTSPMRYYGQFGFVPGIRVGAKSDYGSDDMHGAASDFNGFRFGMLIGGGMEYTIQNDTRLLVGLSLNNGLNNVFKSPYTGKNSYIALNLGVFF